MEPFSFCNAFMDSYGDKYLHPKIGTSLVQIAVLYKSLPTISLKNLMIPFIAKLMAMIHCE